jgi:hypothetical protein
MCTQQLHAFESESHCVTCYSLHVKRQWLHVLFMGFVHLQADMLRKLRGAAGIVETSDMRAAAREREARADKYDGFDMTVRLMGPAVALLQLMVVTWGHSAV